MQQINKIIISGGGTGGHIYPAISIAQALQLLAPDTEILFVGAKDRMEMEKVPQAGYPIKGLSISGLQRRLTWKNLLVPFKLIKSILYCQKLIKSFKPTAVLGVGGYASGPLLMAAGRLNKTIMVQEQNSYAGITNKWVARYASRVFVAYPGMEQFFDADKIMMLGNPIRADIANLENKKTEAAQYFELDPNKPVLFAMGGSLGARTINQSLAKQLRTITQAGIQLLWQTGQSFAQQGHTLAHEYQNKGVRIHTFINRMDLAYALADVVISRAGALSISELCLVGKPAILVPSPNVAEDHQTKNAMALVKQQAALLVTDAQAPQLLVNKALGLLANPIEQQTLANNIKKMARPNAATDIAKEIIKTSNPAYKLP